MQQQPGPKGPGCCVLCSFPSCPGGGPVADGVENFPKTKHFPPSASSQSTLNSVSACRRKLRPLPCSSASHQDRFAGSRREPCRGWIRKFSKNKTFPPIRSVGEWGAYSLIGLLSNGPYLLLSSIYRSAWGGKPGKLSSCQSLKHQVHAGSNSCGSS